MHIVNNAITPKDQQLAIFSTPLLSVIVTLDGNARFLSQCLQSVIAQSFTDYEIIVVGPDALNRSTNVISSLNIHQSYVIKNCGAGEARARNTGIAHARGELVAFINAGDVWTTDKLDKHVFHLTANPSLGVSYSESECISYCDFSKAYRKYRPETAGKLENILCENAIGNASGVVMRREVLKDLQEISCGAQGVEQVYFDEQLNYTDDIHFWMRVTTASDWGIEGLNEVLTWRRVQVELVSKELVQHFEHWEQLVKHCQSLDPIVVNEVGSLAIAYRCVELAQYYASQLAEEHTVKALLNRAYQLDRRILNKTFGGKSIDKVMGIICRRQLGQVNESPDERRGLSRAA
ncbi:glycosyltransferase family 2 protein [Zhongshania sp.]|uniref:glycosyltransferase family 2 protein n=1 Tax=Zhongshania sp. TaxID=1971902 RepID=UPI003566F883